MDGKREGKQKGKPKGKVIEAAAEDDTARAEGLMVYIIPQHQHCPYK